MPVHFNSFIANKNEQLKTKIFSDMIKKYTEKADNVFISDDKSKIHMTSYLKDIHTHRREHLHRLNVSSCHKFRQGLLPPYQAPVEWVF